jgi:hypothetical protein
VPPAQTLAQGPSDLVREHLLERIEVLRALLERGEITQTQERWELRPGAEVVVPETVRAVVLERALVEMSHH